MRRLGNYIILITNIRVRLRHLNEVVKTEKLQQIVPSHLLLEV
jgi:hypothetical protein